MLMSCYAGTIVSAPLGKKYLLTADHCFIGGCLPLFYPPTAWKLLSFRLQYLC